MHPLNSITNANISQYFNIKIKNKTKFIQIYHYFFLKA